MNHLKLSVFMFDTGDAAGVIEKARKAAQLSEALTAANQNNSSAHHMLASSYAQLGGGHASLAETTSAPSVSNKSAGVRLASGIKRA